MDPELRHPRMRSTATGITVLAICIAAVGAANAAPPAYATAVLSLEPVLYYRLDEATGNALNLGSLGALFDGLYQGNVVRQLSTPGGDAGVSFAAAADFIESISTAPVGLTGNPTFTAETVIRVPLAGTAALWAPFLHWGPSPSGSETGRSVYFSFSNDAEDEVYVGFYNGGLQTPSMTLDRDVWHHLVWVRQGGGTDQQGSTLYVDGVDVTASLVADPQLCCNGTTPDVGSTAFRINRARDFDGSRFFVGDMDELVLYDRALTPQEVASNHLQLVPEAGVEASGLVACVVLWAVSRRRS